MPQAGASGGGEAAPVPAALTDADEHTDFEVDAESEPAPETEIATYGLDEDIEPVNLREADLAPLAPTAAPVTAPEPVEPVTAIPSAPAPRPAAPPPPPIRHRVPLEEAIEHAERILANLRLAMEEMEEVLELLEIAAAQKTGDERDIAELRQALQRMQRQVPGAPVVHGHGHGPSHGHGHGHGGRR